MFALVKLIRSFVKIITAQNAAWQVFLGVFIGIFVGMLPWFTMSSGINPLPVGLLLLALFINCHLGSMLLFWGIGALLAWALDPVSRSLAGSLDGLAQSMADIPLAYMCMLSQTQVLGLTILALPLALISAILMTWASRAFDRHLRERLAERKKLKAAGKIASNSIVLRVTCWFFGI